MSDTSRISSFSVSSTGEGRMLFEVETVEKEDGKLLKEQAA